MIGSPLGVFLHLNQAQLIARKVTELRFEGTSADHSSRVEKERCILPMMRLYVILLQPKSHLTLRSLTELDSSGA
jgi:hypothetical protein